MRYLQLILLLIITLSPSYLMAQETINAPVDHYIWERIEWEDQKVNFDPSSMKFERVPDMSGDGVPDFIRVYNNVLDERQDDPSVTIDKTLVYYSGDNFDLSYDTLLYNGIRFYGDFNGDGLTDFVTENGSYYNLINNSLLELESNLIKATSNERISLVQDLNEDGFDDIITEENGDIIIRYGNPSMSMLEKNTINTPTYGSLLQAGVLNGTHVLFNTYREYIDNNNVYTLDIINLDTYSVDESINLPISRGFNTFTKDYHIGGEEILTFTTDINKNGVDEILTVTYPKDISNVIYIHSQGSNGAYSLEDSVVLDDVFNYNSVYTLTSVENNSAEFLAIKNTGDLFSAKLDFSNNSISQVEVTETLLWYRAEHNFIEGWSYPDGFSFDSIDLNDSTLYVYDQAIDRERLIKYSLNTNGEAPSIVAHDLRQYNKKIPRNVKVIGDLEGDGIDNFIVHYSNTIFDDEYVHYNGVTDKNPIVIVKDPSLPSTFSITSGYYFSDVNKTIAITYEERQSNNQHVTLFGALNNGRFFESTVDRIYHNDILANLDYMMHTHLGDIDGDGTDELAFYYRTSPPYRSLISVRNLSAGKEKLIQRKTYIMGRYAGDINKDGYDDILSTYWSLLNTDEETGDGYYGALQIHYGSEDFFDSMTNDTSEFLGNGVIQNEVYSRWPLNEAVMDIDGDDDNEILSNPYTFFYNDTFASSFDFGIPISVFYSNDQGRYFRENSTFLNIPYYPEQNNSFGGFGSGRHLDVLPDINRNGKDELLVYDYRNRGKYINVQEPNKWLTIYEYTRTDDSFKELYNIIPNHRYKYLKTYGAYLNDERSSIVGNFDNDNELEIILYNIDTDEFRDEPIYTIQLTGPSLITSVSPETTTPIAFELKQNYPNPFNPSTTIAFNLKESNYTTLDIFNLAGKKIATLVNDYLHQGNYNYTFNAERYASGPYFYVLKSGDFRSSKSMLLIK